MGDINHEDINDLAQYCISFTNEINILQKDNPNLKNADKLCRCAEGLVRVSRRIVDNKVIGGAAVSNPVSNFWALIVCGFLLFSIGISIGIGYMAIADLENCIYKGMCVEVPQKSN